MLKKERFMPVRPPPASGRPKNRLLATLPPDDFERLRPDLKTVLLSPKQVLMKRDEAMPFVFFPNSGVCSVTSMMKDGAAAEVATVGDEGMVGISAFFGARTMPGECMLQISDPTETTAERLPVDAFRREIDQRGAFHDAVSRYSRGMIALMMQSIGCMALHHVNERCARWLLMTHDRIHSDEFHLSHEFLAMMLGASRPTVTVVAGTLQKAGLIKYSHARVTILDREGLEAASCECYATVKEEFDRLGL
jgi:CRP-like cAMP-binding protein